MADDGPRLANLIAMLRLSAPAFSFLLVGSAVLGAFGCATEAGIATPTIDEPVVDSPRDNTVSSSTSIATRSVGRAPNSNGVYESALHIVTPVTGALIGSHEVIVEGEVFFGTGSPRTVEVNGVAAEISGGNHFRAVLNLEDGEQQIVATTADGSSPDGVAALVGDLVTVTIDATAPRVLIAGPRPSTFLTGSAVRVHGSVLDENTTEIRVDGYSVPVNEAGTFDVTLRPQAGAHRIRVEAVDAGGNRGSAATTFLLGSYTNPREPIASGAFLQLGPEGLAEAETVLEQMIDEFDLGELVLRANPLVTGWWGQIRCDSFTRSGAVEVKMTPKDGYVEARVTLNTITVPFTIAARVGPSVRGTVYAYSVVMTAKFYPTVIDGRPAFTNDRPVVVVNELVGMVDWVPSFIENLDIVKNAIRSRVETGIANVLDSHLHPFLNNMFKYVPTSGSVNVAGMALNIAGGMSTWTIAPDGARALLDVRVTPTAGIPTQGAIRFGGTVYPTRSIPGIAVGASVDLLNSVFHSAWATGAMRMENDLRGSLPSGGMLSVRDVRRAYPGSVPSDVSDSLPITFRISADLPPVANLVTRSGSTFAEIFAPDVRVEIVTNDAAKRVLVTLSFGFRVPLAITSVGTPGSSSGALSVEPKLDQLVISADGLSGRATDEHIRTQDQQLSALAQYIAPHFVKIPALPMPAIAGFDIGISGVSMGQGAVTLSGGLSWRGERILTD